MLDCIGEPISWLRLERHVLARDAAVEAHVEACAACRKCLEEIRGDLVVLRPISLPATAPPRRKWWVVPSFAALAAAVAAIAILVIGKPREPRGDVVAWKGGELVIGLIRERGGAIADDPTTFRAGDRFKVVVTCKPGELAPVEVEVFEVGGYSAAPDRPLQPAQIACGNRVALPGAFNLTGALPNKICVKLADSVESACLVVSPEH